jgi:tellurite methyltransferase
MTQNVTGLGKYDRLYQAAKPFLWENNPGKYVRTFMSYMSPSRVADLGCGDGKNAVWLANEGHAVVAVDISDAALSLATCRLEGTTSKESVMLVRANVNALPFRGPFDAVVMYGLLHCLHEGDAISLKQWVLSNGAPGSLIVGAVVTDGVPLPADHGTGDLYLRPSSWYRRHFAEFDPISMEVGTITEDHEPLVQSHCHEVLRFAMRIN